MGYAFAMSPCVRCKRIFSYNPVAVPSIRVNAEGLPDPNGTREPMCEPCYTALNDQRIAMGLEPWPEPLPGAWEACAEEEL